MTVPTLQSVADAVLGLAKRQGFVTANDIKSELRLAGLEGAVWKDVVALSGRQLVRRQSRYYHKDALNPRTQKAHDQQQAIQKAIRKLIRLHRSGQKGDERRGQERVDFIQPVKVQTDDGKQLALLSRDISTTGVRLLGTLQLLGHKVRVELPDADGQPLCRLTVRILWTCAVGDGLFENGGSFVELLG